MKKIFLLISFLATHFVQAQKAVTVTGGVTYNSSLNYYGRTDSLKSIGITPFVGISLKSGLYFFSQFIFVNNAITSTYAATAVEAGYRFQNEQGSFKGNLFGIGYLYSDDVTLVQSVVKQQAGINLSQLNNVLNVYAGADAKFSNETDFGVYAGVDHSFRIDSVGRKGVIVVSPSAYSYFGTQRFSKTYLEQKRFLIFPTGQESITKNSSSFTALSYELSCPIIYGIGKMNLILTPAYVMPQNVYAADGRPYRQIHCSTRRLLYDSIFNNSLWPYYRNAVNSTKQQVYDLPVYLVCDHYDYCDLVGDCAVLTEPLLLRKVYYH